MTRLDVALVVVAAVLVCAEQAMSGARPKRFRAGAAASGITPPIGASLDGIILRQGPIEHVHDDLFARAMVLDDGRTRLALCACDLCMIPREFLDQAKAIAHKHTGIPVSHMLVSATHTHSAPRIGCGTGELDKEYYRFFVRRIADAIARAARNLDDAEAAWGVVPKPEFPRNRRTLIEPGKAPVNPFDQRTDKVWMHGSRKGIGTQPVGPTDPDLTVLSVQSRGGDPIALLGNYSIHYVTTMGRQVSADYFGYFCRRTEESLGEVGQDPPFVAVMSNGTFGDTGGGLGRGYKAVQRVGSVLSDEAVKLHTGFRHSKDITLAVAERELELGIRQPDAERLAWAKRVLANPKREKGHHPWRLLYAQQTVELSEWPPTVKLKLQAMRIGSLGIVAIPCEPFAETGLAIKKHSPLKPTFTIGLANGYNGYLPTPRDHELGGYTTWAGRGSYLETGAEPKIRAAVLDLLEQVADVPATF